MFRGNTGFILLARATLVRTQEPQSFSFLLAELEQGRAGQAMETGCPHAPGPAPGAERCNGHDVALLAAPVTHHRGSTAWNTAPFANKTFRNTVEPYCLLT